MQPRSRCGAPVSPLREFLFSDDMARASVFLMRESEYVMASLPEDRAPLINIGFGSDLTIRELVRIVADVVGFRGELVWDRSKPDGTPRKWLDSSRLFSFGWKPEIDLREGLARAYADFCDRLA